MASRYALYKGLQKPLVFKGFKGKFIYWGLGALLAGLVLGALTMALVNMYLGVMVLAGSIAGGLFFIAGKQKRGLHAKSRASGIFVYQSTINNTKLYGRKKYI